MAEETIGLLRVVLASNSAQFTTEMGKASASVSGFDNSAKKAEVSTGLLGTAVGKMTTAFAGALVLDRVVGSVISFGKEAFDSAGNILDLASKTGLTTKSIQEMEHAAKLTGTSLTTFTNAAFQLGVRLAGGGDSVRAAVQALGLSYQELMRLSPDEQFRLIAERLGEVENAQERNKLAVELFGRTAKDVLPAIAQGYREIADSAITAGDQQLQALDQARDALDGAYNSAKNLTIQLGGGLVIAVREVWRTFKEATDTALTPFTWAMDRAKDAAEAFGLVSQDIPKVHGPANAALKDGDRAAKALTMSWEEMSRVSDKLTASVTKKTVAVRANTVAIGAMQGPSEKLLYLESRSINDTARLTVELERWARTNGAVLAPSIKQVSAALEQQIPLVNTMQHQWVQFAPTVHQSTTQAEGGILSFFQRVFGGAEGLGASITKTFQQAFLGGGGALGAIQSFATQGLSALLGMIPGIGGFVSAFAGPIVAMLSKLTKKFTDFFRHIFGGPSADELAGRSIVEEFEDSLHDSLTAAQKAEAGNDEWKMTVIALRDAYIAAGKSEEEALEAAKRLWESSKDGAEAAKRVIEEIRRVINNIPNEKNIDINVEYHSGQPVNSGTVPVPENTLSGSTSGVSSFMQGANLGGITGRIQASGAAGASAAMSGSPSTINVLPMLFAQQLTPRQVGQQAAAYLATSGLERDESGIASAFEAVIGNYMRTYSHAG